MARGDKCCWCCKCDKHIAISITGISLSCFEFTLAAIYNYDYIGSGLAIIGIICSGLYLYFNLKDLRQRSESTMSQQTRTTDNEDQQRLVTGVDIMRAQQVEEERKKSTRWSRVLWIVYICFIVLIGTMCFARLVSLLRRIKWRNDLDGQFPTDCGSWAKEKGCTRVTLEASGCVDEKSIKTSNSLVFDVQVDRLLNTQIKECIN